MVSEQGHSETSEASASSSPTPPSPSTHHQLGRLVRRELAAHQRGTDTSPTDGGMSIEVAVLRSAIPSHANIEREKTVGSHVG